MYTCEAKNLITVTIYKCILGLGVQPILGSQYGQ